MNNDHKTRLLAAWRRIDTAAAELMAGHDDYREAYEAVVAEGRTDELESLSRVIGPEVLSDQLRLELMAKGHASLVCGRRVVPREIDLEGLARFGQRLEATVTTNGG